MKKILTIIVSLMIFLTLAGCVYKPGQRPTDYGPAIWISEDPDIWFEVLEFDQNRSYQTKGQLTINGDVYTIMAVFTYTSIVIFRDFEDQDTDYFLGECKFSPEKFIVKVDIKLDNIFNGQVKQITFIRKEKSVK